MIKIVPTLTQIKQLLPQQAITIPKIIAIGSASSGKSSVIEYIVGHDFIPKGTGYITRRPLVVKLHNDKQEYGTFDHLPLTKFYDYKSIKQEIESATNKVAGVDKDISSEPINLHLYSSEYIDLTLVDLPGVIRIPVGKQPYDIEKKTKDIVKDYGMDKDSIFLLAIPANVDFFTCDGLRLLMELDSTKVRTIGVLTKLDLSYFASDALSIIKGDYLKLNLGFVGILGRTQKELEEGISLSQHWDNETKFYAGQEYSKYPEYLGRQCLMKKLNSWIISTVKAQLLSLLDANIKELADLEQGFNKDDILDIIKKFKI